MNFFIFLSEILNCRVLDKQNRPLGRLQDVSLRLSEDVYPKVQSMIIVRGVFRKTYALINFDEIVKLDHGIVLKTDLTQVSFQPQRPKCDFCLKSDILDQQVVDIDNQKVVRVNDVHMLRVDNQLYIAHVDVGLRGLVRRLGWTGAIDGLVRALAPKSPYLKQEEFISWKNTQVLTLGRSKNVLKLGVSRKKLGTIPPPELVEIIQDLDIFEKFSVFKTLDADLQHRVFTDLPISEKEELIEKLSDKETAHLLENIPADEATDLLGALSKERTKQILPLMRTDTSERLRKLLGFAKDSAGGLMTTEYLALPHSATVKDAWEMIKKQVQSPANIYHIYLVDAQHKLVGATSLRRFLNALPETPLKDTCHQTEVYVYTDDDMEEVALLIEKYKFSSIPVVDDDMVLQGVITMDDVLEELIILTWSKYKEKL